MKSLLVFLIAVVLTVSTSFAQCGSCVSSKTECDETVVTETSVDISLSAKTIGFRNPLSISNNTLLLREAPLYIRIPGLSPQSINHSMLALGSAPSSWNRLSRRNSLNLSLFGQENVVPNWGFYGGSEGFIMPVWEEKPDVIRERHRTRTGIIRQ
jgi:hypothetical protein